MKRVAMAGLHHETNTFAKAPTTLNDFITADHWPGLTRGDAFFTAFAQGNMPSSGFIQAIQGVELVPLTWANAQPSGYVTREAYETLVNYILDDLQHCGEIDALYLDLHGAMVCEHLDDGEGELLQRIRNQVGPTLPIVVSHDLHANVSERTFLLSDITVSYRTYPHVDMALTGKRAAKALLPLLATDKKPAKALQRLPFLIPLTAQCTLTMPCLDIYTQLAQLESSHDVLLSFNPCFPTSDTAYTSPTVLGYGADATLAVQQLTHFIEQQQGNFATQLYSEQQAVDYFKAQHQLGNTFIFADTQDNSGCGGTANTMGIFNCLLANNIQNAAVAIICDPQAVVIAAQHNIEDCFELTLGDAFTGRVTLKRLTDGQFVGTGDFYKDFHINLGPMALLEYRGISLLVSSKKMQAADQAVFRHLGLEANAFDLLVLKSSVHFRADFSALAQEIIIVESPGENVADLNKLTYTKCLLKKM